MERERGNHVSAFPLGASDPESLRAHPLPRLRNMVARRFSETCPAYGSARLLRHAELHDLTIAHLDCNAFYAAIENATGRPRDVPVIVGGHHRGVIAACC